MPLLERKTLIDRPVLIDRDTEEEKMDTTDEEDISVEQLGQGGGPVIHNVEFEPGHYDIVAASNVSALLATATEEGQEYSRVFRTAASQLYDFVENQDGDINDLVRFGLENGVAETNLSEEQIDILRSSSEEVLGQEEEQESSTEEEEQEQESSTEEIEDELEEIRDQEEEEQESEQQEDTEEE